MANILKNKTYLYMTEFFSGMSVMAVELYACCGGNCSDMLQAASQNASYPEDLCSQLSKVLSKLVKYEGSGEHVLTDDKAPVEVLGMDMIDELISEEMAYYKGIYKEEGFRGLIDRLL